MTPIQTSTSVSDRRLIAASKIAGKVPGPGGIYMRTSKYPYRVPEPAPVASAAAIRPEVHRPSCFLEAEIESIPSLILNGPDGSGSTKAASPKSPLQGVCAVQRAGPIRWGEMLSIRRVGAVSSSKFSIMTGRSSQELEVCADAACGTRIFGMTRVAAKKPRGEILI